MYSKGVSCSPLDMTLICVDSRFRVWLNRHHQLEICFLRMPNCVFGFLSPKETRAWNRYHRILYYKDLRQFSQCQDEDKKWKPHSKDYLFGYWRDFTRGFEVWRSFILRSRWPQLHGAGKKASSLAFRSPSLTSWEVVSPAGRFSYRKHIEKWNAVFL